LSSYLNIDTFVKVLLNQKHLDMKKALQFLLLFSIIMMGVTHDADAQRKKKKRKGDVDEYFDDKGSFTQRLWYGADISLRFQSTSLGGAPGNVFFGGFSPMVGYKITNEFSVGPRIEFNYQGGRFDIGASEGDLKYNSTNLGVGFFARYKFLETFFLHAEYQRLGEDVAFDIDQTALKVLTRREWGDHPYFGGGYHSSFGVVGFQVTVLWDFSQSFDSGNIPIVYRAGLNYKF